MEGISSSALSRSLALAEQKWQPAACPDVTLKPYNLADAELQDAESALGSEDVAAIAALPVTVKEMPARATIAREGTTSTHCCVLLEGYACRSRTTDSGKRQILSLHIPGEILDLEAVHLPVMDHDITTLSRCTIGYIAHDALLALTRARPMVAAAETGLCTDSEGRKHQTINGRVQRFRQAETGGNEA